MGKTYRGYPPATGAEARVVVSDDQLGGERELELRLDLRNHSPTGFAWGYGGSGPAQLALALCADVLGDDQRALAVYQGVKWRLVARWPMNEPWQLAEVSLLATIVEVSHSAEHARQG